MRCDSPPRGWPPCGSGSGSPGRCRAAGPAGADLRKTCSPPVSPESAGRPVQKARSSARAARPAHGLLAAQRDQQALPFEPGAAGSPGRCARPSPLQVGPIQLWRPASARGNAGSAARWCDDAVEAEQLARHARRLSSRLRAAVSGNFSPRRRRTAGRPLRGGSSREGRLQAEPRRRQAIHRPAAPGIPVILERFGNERATGHAPRLVGHQQIGVHLQVRSQPQARHAGAIRLVEREVERQRFAHRGCVFGAAKGRVERLDLWLALPGTLRMRKRRSLSPTRRPFLIVINNCLSISFSDHRPIHNRQDFTRGPRPVQSLRRYRTARHRCAHACNPCCECRQTGRHSLRHRFLTRAAISTVVPVGSDSRCLMICTAVFDRDWPLAVGAMGLPCNRKEHAQVVRDVGQRPYRRAGIAVKGFLFNRNDRREPDK